MRTPIRIALLLLGVVLAEAILQITAAGLPTVEARLSGLKPRYVSDPILDVRGDHSLPEYDELGFRNESLLEHASVVAIGDSQTEGSGVARDNAWPQQLATTLGTSVYQMAFGSYGPGHYLVLTDQALALRPTTVVVDVYTGNDLAGAYEWVYVKGRNRELRTKEPERDADLSRAELERGPIDRAWLAARDAEKGLYGRPLTGWLRTNIEDRSKIVAVFEQLQWRISGRAASLDTDERPKDWRDTLHTIEGVPSDLLFPFDDGTVRTVLVPRARLAAQDLEDARIAEGLRLTLTILEQIATKCRGHARLLVLLMPTKELVFAERVRAHAATVPTAFQRLVDQETNVRSQLETHLRGLAIETIDPLPELRALLAPSDRVRTSPYPESWDGHPATAGYAAVTRAVAAEISGPPS